MLSGKLRHLYGAYAALLFFVILTGHHSCSARNNNNFCTTSSCGNIRNISYPFRLKTDPKSCGHKNYELICENNVRPTLYLNGGKYYVEAIDYIKFNIRVVDAGVQKDDCSSIPQHSFNREELYTDDIYGGGEISFSRSLTFLTCPTPVQNPPFHFVDTSSCESGNNITSNISSPSTHNLEGYSYVIVEYSFEVSNVPDLCRIDLIYPFPSSVEEKYVNKNMSFMDVHAILVYGFELSWISACCNFAKEKRCDHFNETTMGERCYRYRLTDSFGFVTGSIFSAMYYYRGKPRKLFSIYKKELYRYVNRSISSDLLRVLIVLIAWLIPLLLLNVIYRALLFICGLPCLVILLSYKWRRRHLSMYDNIEEFLENHEHNLMPVRYSYSEIKKITNIFKDKLGEGGFGFVYKGKLRSGRLAAIKMLGKSKANGQDFMNEVATIGRIHHVNVVKLIGFTAEGSKRALVYEFMHNGSLEKYIFSRQGSSISLSNEKIYEISLGVARGIDYLHQGCDMQILHFDIKPHNILLDEKFVPKISDFGLAKLHTTDNSIVSLTAARGTLGYIAPEFFYKTIGGISYKADVYSFGMLLMDMVGRRKNWNALANHSSQTYFSSWVYDQVNEGKDIELEDHATEQEKRTTKKMIIVALWCIQWKPNDRPSMHKVVEMLEANVESLQIPPKPFFTPQVVKPKDDDISNPTRSSEPSNYYMDSSYQYGR